MSYSWFCFAFMSDAPTIALIPMPPTQGQELVIRYDGTPGTYLTLDWGAGTGPAIVLIGPTGEVSLTVPDTETSLVVSDPTPGGASPVVTVIRVA